MSVSLAICLCCYAGARHIVPVYCVCLEAACTLPCNRIERQFLKQLEPQNANHSGTGKWRLLVTTTTEFLTG